MTNFKVSHGLLSLTAAVLTLPAVSAMAADVTPQTSASFVVKSSADSHIRSSARAFKRGNTEKSIRYSHLALKSGLSPKRAAIAHSNLCAAYAVLGDMEAASEACDTALELRPDYEPAITNSSALTVKLAQK